MWTGTQFIIFEWVLVAVTFVMAATRVYVQLRYRTRRFRELLIATAWSFYCITAICDSIMNCYHWYNTNQDYFNNLPRNQVQYVLKLNWGESFLYKPSIYACKAALLCFYGDLAPKEFYPNTNRAIMFTWVFIVLGVLVQIFYDLFECGVEFYLSWSPEGAQCSYSKNYFYSTWSFHIFTDLLVYTIPFFILHQLRNLSLQQKAGAGAMFAVGFVNLLCAGSLLALSLLQYSSPTLLGAYNFMYTLQQASAIMVVCMPQMRLLVSRRYSISLLKSRSNISAGSRDSKGTAGSRGSRGTQGKGRSTMSGSVETATVDLQTAAVLVGQPIMTGPLDVFEEGGKLEAHISLKEIS